jgi:putative restriction endonuclease
MAARTLEDGARDREAQGPRVVRRSPLRATHACRSSGTSRLEVERRRPTSRFRHRRVTAQVKSRLALQRLGQQAFQAVVLGAYSRRCAITGDKVRCRRRTSSRSRREVSHWLDNGLLLRSEVHTLYDRGYLASTPKHRLLDSPRLREKFGNGEQFYTRVGQIIESPSIGRTGRTASSSDGI